MKKLTLQEIDKKVDKVHKGQVIINWEKTGEYKNTKQKVWAQDVSVGEWEVSIDKLLQGRGHPLKKEQRLKLTKDQVELAIKKIHGDTISLDWARTGVFQKKAKQKVWAIDKDFGPWEIKLGDLLKGITHRKRYYLKKTLTKEEVNQRITKLFQGMIKIDWTGIDSFNTKSKVIAIDKDFGSWKVVLSKLLLGAKHPLRARQNMAQGKMLSIEEINQRIKKVHFGKVKIDWGKTGEYKSNEQKVWAIDEDFGSWEIKLHNLLRGQGHLERFLEKRRLTPEEVDEKIKIIFKDNVKIDWNKTGKYNKNSQKVIAVNSKYGEWEIKLNHLLKGVNHPKDSPSSSKGEQELIDWVKQFVEDYVPRKMFIKDGKRQEIDCFIPHINLGIEYHGLYWHSELFADSNKHFFKREFFEKENIRLLQFYENEWLFKKDIVKSIILSKMGLSKEKYNARDLEIKEVKRLEAQNFLEQNHLMGKYLPASYYGLFNENKLVSLMGIQFKSGTLEISRFCNLNNTSVRGGFSKILSFCQKKYSPKQILSFVDLRYGDGKSLLTNGFILESTTLGWNWTDCYETYNRRYCRANMDERRLSEQEHADELGLLKIYDAGQAKFIKKLL